MTTSRKCQVKLILSWFLTRPIKMFSPTCSRYPTQPQCLPVLPWVLRLGDSFEIRSPSPSSSHSCKEIFHGPIFLPYLLWRTTLYIVIFFLSQLSLLKNSWGSPKRALINWSSSIFQNYHRVLTSHNITNLEWQQASNVPTFPSFSLHCCVSMFSNRKITKKYKVNVLKKNNALTLNEYCISSPL